MAAPTGNDFWKHRSKHGRDKLFKSPELMWEAAVEYFEWCQKNPLMEVDFRGKDAEQVQLPRMRPFTMQGLCRYLDCNTRYFAQFKEQIKDKTDNESFGFSSVITRIEETVYEQKFTGAAAGFLNANIIARDLGLADKKDVKSEVVSMPELSIKYDPQADK